MAEPRNLLSREVMEVGDPQGFLWIVSQNRDYRVSLAAIIAAATHGIDKAALGLDRVDNTSDLEKPISQATQAALDNKADKDSVVSVEAFNTLADSLSQFFTEADLNLRLQTIAQAIEDKVNRSELNQIIVDQTQAIVQAIGVIHQRLDLIESGQHTALVSRIVFDQAMDDLQITFSEGVADAIATYVEPITQTLNTLNQDYTAFKQATEMRLTALEAGGGTGGPCVCDVEVGPNDW